MKVSKIKDVYYDPRQGLGGVASLFRALKGKKNVTEIKDWLSGQDTYTLHKPIRYRFKHLKTIVTDIDQQFQADLVDMQGISKHNDNFKYILTCIDVFSRFAWAIPLKNKTGVNVANALERIFDERTPTFLQTDKGKEFLNETVQQLLKIRGIKFFTSQNPDIKAALVERFNRTLKEKMFRYFTYKNTKHYLDVLDDLVYNYNNSYHRSIKMKPTSVTEENKSQVLANIYGVITTKKTVAREHKFKVGDHVRISRGKVQFEKGYLAKWTEEIFVVNKRKSTTPPTYQLEDIAGEIIGGIYYESELQLVKPKLAKDLYHIEKVIATKGKGKQKRLFVKWAGYPSKFNEWIGASEIVKL